ATHTGRLNALGAPPRSTLPSQQSLKRPFPSICSRHEDETKQCASVFMSRDEPVSVESLATSSRRVDCLVRLISALAADENYPPSAIVITTRTRPMAITPKPVRHP